MLYWIAKLLAMHYTPFRVFSYLTLRAILAVMSALSIALLVGPGMIARLSRYQIGQVVRDDGPRSHLPKAGTPTMGGALIIVAIAVSTLLWADLRNRFVWITLGVTVGFGVIGLYDDYLKLVVGNSRGLAARWKYLWQSVLGLGAAVLLYHTAHACRPRPDFSCHSSRLSAFRWELPVFIALAYFAHRRHEQRGEPDRRARWAGDHACGAGGGRARHLRLCQRQCDLRQLSGDSRDPSGGRAADLCSALGGAGLGFLWFNSYPAQVFMGDMGALALGAALGVVAIIVRQEIVALVMGGIFVLETASVILQVASFKLTGRRIFRMAPIHHHFELKGWAEPKVIVRFWIISLLLVLAGLSTLKLR